MAKTKMMALPEAARFAERELGVPTSPASLWRWATKGLRGVVLQTTCFGARRFTTAEAIDQFSRELGKLPPRKKARDGSMPSDEELGEFAARG